MDTQVKKLRLQGVEIATKEPTLSACQLVDRRFRLWDLQNIR